MNSQQEYERQVEILKWMDSRFKGEYEGDRKTQIALCCFDLTLEHHAAICLLYNAGLCGSMFALFRILFESFIRGIYFLKCASEKEMDLFAQDKDFGKSFGQLIAAIEDRMELQEAPFSKLKESAYSIMNSFTHTGYQHLTRRQTNTHTGAINYPDEERAQLLKCCGALVLQTGAYLSTMRKDNDHPEEVLSKIKEIYPRKNT